MWHIGQDIVCVKTHKLNAVKEGDVFTIKGLKYHCCGLIAIDVGIIGDFLKEGCGKCKKTWPVSDNKYWLSERLFKPLDELSDISELLEVLELETVV